MSIQTLTNVVDRAQQCRSPDFVLSKLEKGFNYADSMPIISVFTSPLRAKLGLIQIAYGTLMMFLGRLMEKKAECANKPRWIELQNHGVEHIKHGSLNFARGTAESIIASATLGFGNLGFAAVQLETGFDPLIRYNNDEKNEVVYEAPQLPRQEEQEAPLPLSHLSEWERAQFSGIFA